MWVKAWSGVEFDQCCSGDIEHGSEICPDESKGVVLLGLVAYGLYCMLSAAAVMASASAAVSPML